MLMIFESKEVEVFEWNGQVLFNPYHCGECLGLGTSAVRMAIGKMNNKQVVKLKNSDVKDVDFRKLNNAGENFLTESGVYKLIFKSQKKEAEKFQDWVTDEVLPQIRKTGGYIPVDEKDNEIEIMAKALQIMDRTIKMMDKTIDSQDIKIKELEGDVYKLEGLAIKGYSLKDLSTCLGYKERFLDDYCISQGWYSRINHDVLIKDNRYVKRLKKNSINFTDLGRETLIEKFRDNSNKLF